MQKKELAANGKSPTKKTRASPTKAKPKLSSLAERRTQRKQSKPKTTK